MPKVSVITPAYNVEPFIAQCIESVQAQTLQDWEMIIVDDCSTDGTVAVVERYLDDPRIKLFRNPQNMGAGYTRNCALDHARGEWIAVLDSDDWYAPQRLERLVQFAEQNQIDAVADLVQHVAPDGTILKIGWSTYGRNPKQPRFYSVYEVISVHPSCQPVVRQAFLQSHQIRYIPHIHRSQDFAFFMEILVKGAQFAVVPEPMYYYRIRPNSIIGIYNRHKAVEQLCKSHEYLKSLPELQKAPKMVHLLDADFRRAKMFLLYPEFADYLKARRWRKALEVAHEAPGVWWHLFKSIPSAIYRRAFARDKLVDYRESCYKEGI